MPLHRPFPYDVVDGGELLLDEYWVQPGAAVLLEAVQRQMVPPQGSTRGAAPPVPTPVVPPPPPPGPSLSPAETASQMYRRMGMED